MSELALRGGTPVIDRPLAPFPIRVAQLALVQLAVGIAGHFGREVDRLRRLELGQPPGTELHDLLRQLRPGLDVIDLLRATFPGGSITGAPKIRAMEIIDALEPAARGPYAGAVGYLSFSGDLDTCITIRTLVVREGETSVTAGAGIVVVGRQLGDPGVQAAGRVGHPAQATDA